MKAGGLLRIYFHGFDSHKHVRSDIGWAVNAFGETKKSPGYLVYITTYSVTGEFGYLAL